MTQLFFITGMGRSGSMFLANLLNKCEGGKVLHEPVIKREQIEHLKAFKNEEASLNYISHFRKKIILDNAKGLEFYGEVNSYLRNHVPALKKVFPEAKLLHLVRDGRDVVRSICCRNTFKENDKTTIGVEPEGGWKKESRFEKICWYWVESNDRVSKHIDKYINLEKIISDWDYFKTNILDYLGLKMSRKLWEDLKAVRINKNKTNYDKWTEDQKNIFNVMCEKTMEKFGYYNGC